MINRMLEAKLLSLAAQFPVVTVTGPRQSGKSTLVQHAFPGYRYVSLEDEDMRGIAHDDPRMFLERFDNHVIFDEVQRVPELFSYMQGVIDRMDTPGQYILSGSQNFLLLKSISQSLAGRVAIMHLLPLAYSELEENEYRPASINEFLFNGGYPRLHVRHIAPSDFFPNYISTYIDRDVRLELGVRKIAGFNTFVSLCATRIGEVLNLESLANDCDISVDTARSWLSVTLVSQRISSASNLSISSSKADTAAVFSKTRPSWRPSSTRRRSDKSRGCSSGATAIKRRLISSPSAADARNTRSR